MSVVPARPTHRGRAFVLKAAIVGVTCAALVGGIAQSAQAALTTGPTTTGVTGIRPSATNLSFSLSDRVTAKVEVATGNLLVTTNGITLPGINSTVGVGAAYNSRGWQNASTINGSPHP